MNRCDIIFPDKRTDGNTPLRQAQIVMLRILCCVDDLCKKHKISYWLDGGSALGAVRHHGFIPWDDDIDICMLRKDYNKFLSFCRHELPQDLFLQAFGKDLDYYLHWAKIRDKYSFYNEVAYEKTDFHKGIGIDIFPCDFIPGNNILPWIEKSLAKSFRYRCKNRHTDMSFVEKINFAASKCLCTVINLDMEKRLFSFFHSAFKKHNHWVGYGIATPFRGRYSLDTIFPTRKMMFEGFLFPVPRKIEKYLTTLYGNYNVLPDRLNRKSHADIINPVTPCNHKEILTFLQKNRVPK